MDLTITALRVTITGQPAPVLDIPHLVVPSGTQLAICGASGSGKTTLLQYLCGLSRGVAGSVLWGETDIHRLSTSACDLWRGANIGLIMQDFHLITGLSALDNVLLPQAIAHFPRPYRGTERAKALLQQLGIARPEQRTATLSRGEMQRVAIARALLVAPKILIADEPTASLDADNSAAITQLLLQMASAQGATLLCVTHDPLLQQALPARIDLQHGQICHSTLEEQP